MAFDAEHNAFVGPLHLSSFRDTAKRWARNP
jgi:hypothetical protein